MVSVAHCRRQSVILMGNVKPKTGNDVICFVYFRCGTAYVIEEVKSVKM